MADWVSTAIQGGSGIVGGIIAGGQNRRNRDSNEKQNKLGWQHDFEVMDYQNRLNEENYLKYDSPLAQMRQYQEAGLNPNLIYGQMQDSGTVGSVQGQNSHQNPYQSTGNVGEIIANTGTSLASILSQRDQQDKLLQHQKDLAYNELEQQAKQFDRDLSERRRSNRANENIQFQKIQSDARSASDALALGYAQLKAQVDRNNMTHKEFEEQLSIARQRLHEDLINNAAQRIALEQNMRIQAAQHKMHEAFHNLTFEERNILHKYLMYGDDWDSKLSNFERQALPRLQRDKMLQYIFQAASQFTGAAAVLLK